jgi:hydrogenase maturation protease
MPDRPLIVGLGSDHGDDRAGWLVVEQLRRTGWNHADAKPARHAAEILDWAEPSRPLVICDACQGSGPVGTYKCWTWPESRSPARPRTGTHDLGLPAALELAVLTARLPPKVMVWTIEGANWRPGSEVSGAVSEAARTVAAFLLQEREPCTSVLS